MAMTVLPARASPSSTSISSSWVVGVDPGDRLVEQVQLGLGGDRPGEEDPPALTARQRADLAIAGGRPSRRSRSAASTRLAVARPGPPAEAETA